MINFQAPAPAYMLRQNGQTVFAQPAGGAIFTSPMYPSQRGGMNGLGSLSVQPQRTVLEMDTGFTVSDPNCGVLNVAVLPRESNQQAYERAKAAWAAKYGHLVPAPNESEQQARCRMEMAYRQAQANAQANAQQLALHQQHGTMFAPQSAPAPALVDPAWQQSLHLAPTYAVAQPMMFTDAQMLQAQQMAAGSGSGMHIVNTSPSLAPSTASLSPVAPFQPFAAPIQHSDPMAAAREEIARREAEAAGVLFDRPIDGGDAIAKYETEKLQREAQQRHQAYLAQEAASWEEARRQLAANAPPVEQSNATLWVFQPFAAPIQHSDPMAAAREEIARREAEAAGVLFDRPIDGGDAIAKYETEKLQREAQQRHQAYLAQEAAWEAKRQLAANAPPVEQSNTLLWVGLGAAAFGVAWWMMSGKGAAA